MINKKNKYLFYGVIFAVSVILFEAIFGLSSYFDDTKPLVEEYINDNIDIKKRAGSIKALFLKRKDVVDGSDRRPLYKKYFYIVQGDKSNVLVTIKVGNLNSERNLNINLVSIKEVN